ncbi:MAG: glycerol-3-phosphate 1-O-acyltransferase PlsY [Candidatus Kapabacteria bacterium]|nr:glycerol-3-phosphate 1-O-acyltransferase PlsY [Candidatus Kapabacteria bacterium]
MENIAGVLAISAVAYAIGGFPTGLLVGRLLFGVDIRKHGSGNIGSTNVLRTLGWQWGLIVQVVDILKGVMAVTLIPALLAPTGAGGWEITHVRIAAGVAAVTGHCWPIWTGFRGGKGVNTAAGVLAVLAPVELLLGLGGFALALLMSGYVSLGSLTAAVLVPLAIAIRLGWVPAAASPLFWGTTLIALLVIIRHRDNIIRLLKGTEHRFHSVWLLGRLRQQVRRGVQ